ncbi:MAG: hypothetical protein RTU30_02465 [Candidatus Thorarchaeota archaeon]
MSLVESGKIKRFVLTYHSRGDERDNLYLCIDVPGISECTMDTLLKTESLQPISEYLITHIDLTHVKIGNYEDEIKNSNSQEAVENASPEFLTGIVERTLDNASRGSMAALRILKEGPNQMSDWKSLVERVLEYCEPLNGDEFVSDTAHFCFNSLGVNPNEEIIARKVSVMLDRMIQRLFNRESWDKRFLAD